MKKLLMLAFAVCLFAACSKDDDTTLPVETFDVISFEPAEKMLDLETNKALVLKDVTMNLYDIGDYTYRNVFCGKDYVSAANERNLDGPLFATADGRVKFSSYYAWEYDAWGGIVIAQLPDMKAATVSLKQQFSVWADGGANGTPTYAVFYDSNSPSESWPAGMSKSGYPTIELTTPREIDHFYIANSTYVYNYFQGEDMSNYQVKITGWLKGAEKGSVTEMLVGGKSKLAGWRKVSLASLGAVDKVVFKVICNYATDPCFFCVDEIALKKIAK